MTPPRTDSAGADQLLRAAIRDKRLVTFVLDGCRRIAEPHDYGVMSRVPRLFFYQTGGENRSPPPTGWRWAALAKISQLRILDETFRGPRPAPSGKHVRWDELFATVSSRPVPPPTTPGRAARAAKTRGKPRARKITSDSSLAQLIPSP